MDKIKIMLILMVSVLPVNVFAMLQKSVVQEKVVKQAIKRAEGAIAKGQQRLLRVAEITLQQVEKYAHKFPRLQEKVDFLLASIQKKLDKNPKMPEIKEKEARNLRVVAQLQDKLQRESVVVIFGAPGSGKTELMTFALAGQSHGTFDLRNSFLNHYYEQKKVVEEKEKADIKKQYAKLKEEELEWISQEKEAVIKQLAASPEKIIVFDEFDLGGTFKSGTPDLRSAQIVLEMAKVLREKGKKIILIIHDETFQSPELMSVLLINFNSNKSNIIRTGYFSPREERFLLEKTSLTPDEQKRYMEWALGNPSAHLPLITSFAKGQQAQYSLKELKESARESVGKAYRVATISNKSAAEIAKQIAIGKKSIKDVTFNVVGEILNTGLIGLRDGDYVMSPLAKEVISKKS